MIVDGFARGYPRFFSRVLQSTSPNKKHNPTSEGNDLLYIRVNLRKQPMFVWQQLIFRATTTTTTREGLASAYGLRNLTPTPTHPSFRWPKFCTESLV
jgi:hypothetical protein